MLQKLIFLSGLRKSGTSMVRNLLDSHPEFFCYPFNEFPIFSFTHHHKVLKGNRRKGTKQRDIPEIIEAVLADKWWRFSRSEYRQEKEGTNPGVDLDKFHELLRQSTAETYKDLIEDILVSVAKSSKHFNGDPEKLSIAVKSVQDEEHFPELLKWFPCLKFVYILRSPYGQLNSAINNMRHRKLGEKVKHQVNRDFKNLNDKIPYPYLGKRLKQMKLSYYFMRKYSELEPDHFYVLNYDKLLQCPEEQMRELCNFLEIEFQPCLLEATVGGKAWTRKGWSVGQHESGGISAAPLHAWKKQLSPLAIRLVNLYFPDIIEDYGFEYVPSRSPLWKRFSRSEKLKVYLANRSLFFSSVRRLVG